MSPSALAGRRIVLLRTPEQARETADALRRAGAAPIVLPTIAIAPPADPVPLRRALDRLDRYRGFLFTSVHAVQAVFAGRPRMRPAGAWVCAIGPATARALPPEWRADIVPPTADAEGVVRALSGRGLQGAAILFPRAAVARDRIPQVLAARGARLEVVTAYRTVIPAGAAAAAQALFPVPGPPGADAVLFTSGATARHLAQALGPEYRRRLAGVVLVAIGPPTRDALIELDLAVCATAAQPSSDGLLAALASCWNHA